VYLAGLELGLPSSPAGLQLGVSFLAAEHELGLPSSPGSFEPFIQIMFTIKVVIVFGMQHLEPKLIKSGSSVITLRRFI
jgi:hypothetical protein